MTRKEAIQVLRDWDGYFIGHGSDDVNKALNMAIKELEKELIFDKIRDEIEELYVKNVIRHYVFYGPSPKYIPVSEVLQIIDKYKAESEET